ncbi:MAG: tryptophan-rich sensory protein [Candidatus Daviesbacteria bacterium]|nr:tryptophan-rich sensory protein [Candidatus Daviesbacteria bacterium]
MPKVFKFVASILLCEGAGILGSFFTIQSIPTWYATLNKPPFSPPNFIFGPVWTILYFLMGVSLYLVWESNTAKNKKMGIKLFLAQLGVNSFWSIIFFGYRSPIGGLVTIILMWFLILKTIQNFQQINKTAALLLYPYLAWVTFATILNLSIVLLNP